MELQILLLGLVAWFSTASADQSETINYDESTSLSIPSYAFIGKENGDILRCLYTDPEQCELFYQLRAIPTFITVHGDFLYGALTSGVMVRCDLRKTNSCEDFNNLGVYMSSLYIGKGYILAGLHSGKLMKCDLYQFNSCSVLHTFGNDVISVIEYDDYIFVGLDSYRLMRCSVITKNNCTVITTTTNMITEFSVVNNNLFAVVWDGNILKCTSQSCEKKTLPMHFRSMSALNGFLYITGYENEIVRCKWDNVLECSKYANNSGRSLTFTYSTRTMEDIYRDEQNSCTWQNENQLICPPFVIYYDDHQRATMEVRVKNGKLVDSRGSLIDTSTADEGDSGIAAIFAMGHDGRIFLSNEHKRGLHHTSSLLAGAPASGAGEMVVKNGVIEKIVACSEHYNTDLTLNKQVIQSLQSQGYSEPIISELCYF